MWIDENDDPSELNAYILASICRQMCHEQRCAKQILHNLRMQDLAYAVSRACIQTLWHSNVGSAVMVGC